MSDNVSGIERALEHLDFLIHHAKEDPARRIVVSADFLQEIRKSIAPTLKGDRMRMITGRGTMKVDCVLVTEPMTIGGKDYKPGDLLVSDGDETWGVPYERWTKRIKGREMRGIMEAAMNRYGSEKPAAGKLT